MSRFAGSAIKQGPNVGRIDKWSQRNPTTEKPLWLLLSGASDPPKEIEVSKRKPRDAPGVRSGAFLAGVTLDLSNMEGTVEARLFNTVKDLYLTKDVALGHIKRFFETCRLKRVHPMLYYTGHGEIGTGNWCFNDGTISIQEIFGMVPAGCFYPMIFSDACYSGHWANFCINKGIAGFQCLAACPEYSTAVDTKGKGGDLTLFMTGRKPRPSTEPIYSEGNRLDFPITRPYNKVNYVDFISCHIKNTDKLLISQSMHDGYFCGIFGTSKLYSPRPAQTWGIRENYDSFVAFVEEEWSKSKRIYSLACDEKFGFGVLLMENCGTNQTILRNTDDIKKNWDIGLKITACAARGSTFYIIMTKDTKEYHGKLQKWFTVNTWSEVRDEINEGYQNGMAVTAICYSTGLKQYFVVMTETHGGQSHKWFEDNDVIDNWVDEKYEKGLHPTIVFKDPADDKFLIVMTEDENRSDYLITCNYQLE